MAGASADEVEDILGENGFEGDTANDVNAQGGIDKFDEASRSAQRPKITRT